MSEVGSRAKTRFVSSDELSTTYGATGSAKFFEFLPHVRRQKHFRAETASQIAEKRKVILQIAVGTHICLLYCWTHNQHAVAVAFLSRNESNWLKKCGEM